MNILLLGAGFSRNWHGWLATELVGELLGRLRDRTAITRQLRDKLNFEETLGNLQIAAETTGFHDELNAMQLAITETFKDMNRSFVELAGLEFSSDQNRRIATFLGRFDAIFTLNQDLLLELHYDPFPNLWCTPGAQKPPGWDHMQAEEKISSTWTIDESAVVPTNTQPVFKLHGSVNWRDQKDRNLIVMGISKATSISKFPLLAWYFAKFREMLNAGNSKLMVIGYGFGDPHINNELKEASERSDLNMYLVDPAGLQLFEPPANQAIGRMKKFPEFRWIGVSTRPFRDAFVGDRLQYESLVRFFKP